MIITFKELGINPADYTGIRYGVANALIVDKACDYILAHHTHPMEQEIDGTTEEDYIINAHMSATDFVLGLVYVPTIWDEDEDEDED